MIMEMAAKKYAFIIGISILSILLSGCDKSHPEVNGEESVTMSAGEGQSGSEVKSITWMYAIMSGGIPKDIYKVQEAVNKITIPEIGVQVNLKPAASSNYAEQINLTLASGDKVDLITTAGSNIWTNLTNEKQVLPLDVLLQEYGQGILEEVPQKILNGTKISGKTYGISVNSVKTGNFGIIMRQDILEKYNLIEKAEQLKAVSDVMDMEENFEILESIFATVKENEPDMIILYPQSFQLAANYDNLSDTLGVVMGDEDLVVENYYASEAYRTICEKAFEWGEKGYIIPELATTNETDLSLLQSGNLFAYFDNPGCDKKTEKDNRSGYVLMHIPLKLPTISTSSVIKIANCIPKNSSEPEAAMKFLNLLYTNEELVNLMCYGIEGSNYIVEEDGRLNYPEGTNESTSGYSPSQPWMYGNYMLSKYWSGTVITHEDEERFIDSASVSPCYGFVFDSTDVQRQIVVCTSVVAEYANGLQMGILDPREKLPEFLKALEKSGIQDIIDEKQRQLNVWHTSNQ